MKIIILGAGQVGSTLAANLVSEDNDITLIDDESMRLEHLQDKHDLRVMQGLASSPKVLREAGAPDADLLIAVTGSDEINMVACQIAYTLFNTPTKIARIRNGEYLKEKEKLFNPDVLPIDHIISPENLVTKDIVRLIEYPGALQVAHLAKDKISLVVVKAYYGGPLVGYPISTLKEHIPHVDCRVVSILRQDKAIRPQGSTIIEASDEVTFICATAYIKAVMSELQRLEKPYKRIMIVGGGNVGTGVAKQLEDHCTVKLIERNTERAAVLAEKLSKTLVFNGDASDQSLLFEEHIENIDVFLSLSSDDEANIMSALLAKRLGAKKAMVLIQRMAYISLIQGGTIDIAISPQQATISALLGHVRKGDVANVVSLRHGLAEALEIIIHGDETTSNVIGRLIGDLKLPTGAIIGAILRGNEVIIGDNQLVIQEGDHVVVYLSDKKYISDLEKLFQPSAFFI
ncbi:potassium transporter peripheral membrane component [Aggregatibacter actinomycetemcomitans]|uniref:Trk system potassium uptake protein TrkA n=1 Tax=Aggregatibacter actinomycetemcomitans TaxID=714 RepID=A0A5D0EI65_AGGAC|nr:Trk system potassium transporter TrkA [Aggregatibacter actinomycetemcomitans]AFI87516.1 potassium transporter peripheral membrane component [Aggregatibacter actinomycetemcomitans D7S-1]AMQ93726.1 potassium transporter peripheral membrane component [Aggregatibacter actinomycetemcomitans]EKX97666.1 potassium transporter peripheral membrane component [Aggregatibacter actinomycetemcomitans Y4]KND85335.1 potassium transporter peripheral membrane component [Aggregatibacter actinomycetemcomitans se